MPMKSTLFILLLCLSCTVPDSGENKNIVLPLEANRIELSGVALFKVEHLFMHNGDYVAIENSGDHYLKLIGKDGQLKNRMARKGFGPKEFKAVVARSFTSNGELIQGIEASNNVFHLLRIGSEEGTDALEKYKPIQMPLRTQFVNDGIVFGDSLIIGSSNGDLLQHDLFKYDVSQDSLTEIPIAHNFSFLANLSQAARYELLFKHIVKHPTQSKLALLYTKFGQVSIYNLEMDVLHEWRSESDLQKLAESVENNRVNYDNLSTYNLSVAASTDYIFGLSLGRTNKAMKEMTAEAMMSLKPLVYVWDWEGSLVATLELDRPLAAITYDPEQHHLVGVSPFIENEIYTYALPTFEK